MRISPLPSPTLNQTGDGEEQRTEHIAPLPPPRKASQSWTKPKGEHVSNDATPPVRKDSKVSPRDDESTSAANFFVVRKVSSKSSSSKSSKPDEENDANSIAKLAALLQRTLSDSATALAAYERDRTVGNGVLLPSHAIVLLWRFTFSILCLLYFIFLPLELTLYEAQEKWLQAFYAVCHVFFLVDILFHFSLASTRVLTRPAAIVSRRMIAFTYLRSWFSFDVLTALPLDCLPVGYPLVVWLRVPRLFKVLRCYHFYNEAQFSHLRRSLCIRLAAVAIAQMIFAHWRACLVLAIAEDSLNDMLNDENTALHLYIVSLSFALSEASTSGLHSHLNIHPNWRFLLFCLMLASVCLGALLFAMLFSFVHHNSRAWSTRANRSQLRAVRKFFEQFDVPAELQDRIYTHHAIASTKGGDSSLIDSLPSHLRFDVCAARYRSLLQETELFSQVEDESFIQAIVSSLREEIYLPGEYIIRVGDYARDMYFVASGELQVYSTYFEKTGVLKRASYFGEVALFGSAFGHRTANVVALTYSEVLLWSKDDADIALMYFPTHKSHLYRIANAKAAATNTNANNTVRRSTSSTDHFKSHDSWKKSSGSLASLSDCRKSGTRTSQSTMELGYRPRRAACVWLRRLRLSLSSSLLSLRAPHTTTRRVWNAVVAVCTVAVLVLWPLPLLVPTFTNTFGFWVAMALCDVVNLLAFVLKFYTWGYWRGQLSEQQHTKPFLWSTRFYFDILGIVPIEIFGIRWPLGKERDCAVVLLRFNRLFRYYSLLSYFTTYDEHGNKNVPIVRIAAHRTVFILKAAFLVFGLAHVFACLMCFIAAKEPAANWQNIVSDSSVSTKYFTAVYWFFGFFASGAVDVSATTQAERVAVLPFVCAAHLVHLYLLAVLASLVVEWAAADSSYSRRWEALDAYVRCHQLPPALARRVRAHVAADDACTAGLHVSRVSSTFSSACSLDVKELWLAPFLSCCPIFPKTANGEMTAFTRALLASISYSVLAPSESIYHEGFACTDMLFLRRGCIGLSTGESKTFMVLKDNNYFGERACLPARCVHMVTCTTLSVCEVFFFEAN